MSERGVDPALSWPARGRAHIREMMPFENKRIFRTCLTQTGAKITLILVFAVWRVWAVMMMMMMMMVMVMMMMVVVLWWWWRR